MHFYLNVNKAVNLEIACHISQYYLIKSRKIRTSLSLRHRDSLHKLQSPNPLHIFNRSLYAEKLEQVQTK